MDLSLVDLKADWMADRSAVRLVDKMVLSLVDVKADWMVDCSADVMVWRKVVRKALWRVA